MRSQNLRRNAIILVLLLSGLLLAGLPAQAGADASAPVDHGNTAWILISTAMVLLMTLPGLALFYGGLVSERNVLSTLAHSFIVFCLIGIQWVLWGYSLSFGPDIGGFIGGLNHLAFSGVGLEPIAGAMVPELAFAMFQGAFAIITVALISGAFAERMRLPAFVLFSLLWATLVYAPIAHWVWGGGWLSGLGVLDFAGGTVVHISSGVSALVAALVIGRRAGYPERVEPPHNIPFTLIGAALLWFGWFGFNAGSALAADGLAALAFAVTYTSAAAAGLTWAAIEWALHRRITVTGAVSGVVGGLVAITPAAGFVSVPAALAIGAGSSIVCYLGVGVVKRRLGYDDTLDVFGIHGLGGVWGAFATGIFASTAVNPDGANGLLFGNPGQLWAQLVGVAAAVILSATATFVILRIVALVTPLRVTEADEQIGLDMILHGEAAYAGSPALGNGRVQVEVSHHD